VDFIRQVQDLAEGCPREPDGHSSLATTGAGEDDAEYAQWLVVLRDEEGRLDPASVSECRAPDRQLGAAAQGGNRSSPIECVTFTDGGR
jgi:hypothetical protein